MVSGAARVLVCLALVGSLWGTHAAQKSATTINNQWAAYNQQRQTMRVNNAPMGDTLRGVLDYAFSTPLNQIQSSNVYQAGNSRFRRVVDDLRKGNPIKIVAIGGVATNGSDASRPGIDDYFALYVKYLKRAFPGARIDPVRSSAGIAPSAVVAECLSNYLPTDADVVLLEMTTNDAVAMDPSVLDGHNAKAYEMLMRNILKEDKQPALILTQVRTGCQVASGCLYLHVQAAPLLWQQRQCAISTQTAPAPGNASNAHIAYVAQAPCCCDNGATSHLLCNLRQQLSQFHAGITPAARILHLFSCTLLCGVTLQHQALDACTRSPVAAAATSCAQSMVHGMGNGTTPFYLTPEAPQYAALSSYYGTPVVSMRNALWGSGNPNSNGEIVSTAVEQGDGSTPLTTGHKSISDMLVYNTQKTAQDLLVLPYGDYDANSIAGSVPEKPVYGGERVLKGVNKHLVPQVHTHACMHTCAHHGFCASLPACRDAAGQQLLLKSGVLPYSRGGCAAMHAARMTRWGCSIQGIACQQAVFNRSTPTRCCWPGRCMKQHVLPAVCCCMADTASSQQLGQILARCSPPAMLQMCLGSPMLC